MDSALLSGLRKLGEGKHLNGLRVKACVHRGHKVYGLCHKGISKHAYEPLLVRHPPD
jgi:hypothetical protein